MQPVEPSTIVRGPAAFTISFMISADSQPWHVRWPDEKYSSMVTFLIPRNGSRTWVALANVSAMAWSPLFAHAEPVRLGVGLPGIRGSETEDGRLDALARRSEEHTSELQSLTNLVCRLLLVN